MEQKGENQENTRCYKNLYTYGPFHMSSKFIMSRSRLKYMMTRVYLFSSSKETNSNSCNAFE